MKNEKPSYKFTSVSHYDGDKYTVEFFPKHVVVSHFYHDRGQLGSARLSYRRAKQILQKPRRQYRTFHRGCLGKELNYAIEWETGKTLFVGCKIIKPRVRRRLLALIEKYERQRTGTKTR
jgi:hypothetical protein